MKKDLTKGSGMNKTGTKASRIAIAAALALAVAIGLTGCAGTDSAAQREPATNTPDETAEPTPTKPVSKEEKQKAAKAAADRILQAIKAKDMNQLAAYVDPEAGVRFSPYGTIDTKQDLVFTAEQLQKLTSDNKEYVWGSYDGSGEPIKLTFNQYYGKFVYDHDFAKAPKVGINTVVGTGNTLNNIAEAYPGSTFVEYHFPGFDKKYEGMDWASLRLVLTEAKEGWKLVGIVHDQWTI